MAPSIPKARLEDYLQDKQLLLVLDNFEQVVGAAPLLSELLEVCLTLKLLITSREVLHLRAEHQFVVPPLALPDLKHPL
jgi:predicted ATPase